MRKHQRTLETRHSNTTAQNNGKPISGARKVMSTVRRVGVEPWTLALEIPIPRRNLDFLIASVCLRDVRALCFLHGAVSLQGQSAIAGGDAELETWLAGAHVLFQTAASANAQVEFVAEICLRAKNIIFFKWSKYLCTWNVKPAFVCAGGWLWDADLGTSVLAHRTHWAEIKYSLAPVARFVGNLIDALVTARSAFWIKITRRL